ncbi:hypothetical protein [Desulforhopalus sp. 52FAK]
MSKRISIVALCLAFTVSPTLAHHPTADMVDEEIYAMIDELVSDTPHATMVFDSTMETTTITVSSVSDAEDIIDDYLLAGISLLDDEVTVSISFGDYVELVSTSVSSNSNEWSERSDWGREVIISVDTLLCSPQSVEGCINID